jgi:hypothetical protein
MKAEGKNKYSEEIKGSELLHGIVEGNTIYLLTVAYTFDSYAALRLFIERMHFTSRQIENRS